MRSCLLAVPLGLLVSLITPAQAQTQSWLDGMETVTHRSAPDVRRVAETTAQTMQDDFLEPANAGTLAARRVESGKWSAQVSVRYRRA